MALPLPGWQPLTGFCDPLSSAAFTPPFGGGCHFAAFIQLIKNGITDLVLFSTLLAVAALMYTGFQLLFAQGKSNALTEVKKTFGKIFTGYLIIVLAWVVVYTISTKLLNSDFTFLLG